MKKITLLSAVIVALIQFTTDAQTLCARQANIYFGQPKKSTLKTPVTTIVTEFDRNGRVTVQKEGKIKIVYEWSDSKEMVFVKTFYGSSLQSSTMVHVDNWTPNEIRFSYYPETVTTIEFDARERLLTNTTATNGETLKVMKFLYKDTSSMFPTGAEIIGGGKTVSSRMSGYETDSHGNFTRYATNVNGTTVITTQKIEYYR